MPFSSSSGSHATTVPIGLSGSDGYEIQSDSQGLACPGLDRFGRLIETIWQTSGGASQLVHTQYGRTRFGAVTWRYDAKAHSLGTTAGTQQDNFYEYDGLYRPTLHQRGTLNAYHTGIDSQQQTEVFNLDQMGNWLAYQNDQLTPSQTRDFNPLNEITDLTNPTGVIQPAYDLAGNMTTIPAPADWTVAYTLTWDAWNRLTRVAEGSTLKGAYRYDALNRRLTTTLDDSTFRHYYYSGTQVLEERLGTTFDRDYLWGLRGERDLIRRRTGMSTPVYLYCLTDGPNPVAVTSTSGTILERYSYDTYGTVRCMNPAFNTIGGSAHDWNFVWRRTFMDLQTSLLRDLGSIYTTTIGLTINSYFQIAPPTPTQTPAPPPTSPPAPQPPHVNSNPNGKECCVDATWLEVGQDYKKTEKKLGKDWDKIFAKFSGDGTKCYVTQHYERQKIEVQFRGGPMVSALKPEDKGLKDDWYTSIWKHTPGKTYWDKMSNWGNYFRLYENRLFQTLNQAAGTIFSIDRPEFDPNNKIDTGFVPAFAYETTYTTCWYSSAAPPCPNRKCCTKWTVKVSEQADAGPVRDVLPVSSWCRGPNDTDAYEKGFPMRPVK